MRWSDRTRVGLTVAAGLLLLGFVTFFLRGSLGGGGAYLQPVSFPNAQGIQEGAYVRVRGVDMGSVEKVGLGADNQALLTLRIRNAYRVKPDDSIRIVGGLLGFSPPSIEITPGGRKTAAAGGSEVLTGETGPNTDRLLTQGEKLLDNLNGLSGRMNRLTESLARIAEDPEMRGNLAKTTRNFARVSEKGVAIANNMERATAGADRLVSGFQSTASQLDRTLRKADGVMASFKGTAEQSRALMTDTRGLVRDTRDVVHDTRKAVQDVDGVVKSTNTVIQNAGGLVTDTRAALTENRERLSAVFNNLNASLKQLDATLSEARSFVGDPQLRSDLKVTAANVRESSENLKKLSGDVQSLTGDRKVQEDLRETLSNLRDATEEAADVFRRVKGVMGTGRKGAETVTQRISSAEVNAGIVRTMRDNRTRLEFDATIPWSQRTFYRLGFYDFGESNRFNVQMGQQVRSGVWARYGFYASRLGVGLDFGNQRRPPFQIDVFGVDNPQVDLRSNVRLTSFLDLSLGLDNISRRPDPVVGLRYRK
jgi:phospholipid/cholesterol/gamma-HCH transport system substrate-binding protein